MVTIKLERSWILSFFRKQIWTITLWKIIENPEDLSLVFFLYLTMIINSCQLNEFKYLVYLKNSVLSPNNFVSCI